MTLIQSQRPLRPWEVGDPVGDKGLVVPYIGLP